MTNEILIGQIVNGSPLWRLQREMPEVPAQRMTDEQCDRVFNAAVAEIKKIQDENKPAEPKREEKKTSKKS